MAHENQIGRFLYHDEEKYYSPNCSHVVPIPPSIADQDMDILPFKTGVRWQDFHDPVRWTRAYGWTSFIPTEPIFKFYPFDRLRFVPPAVVDTETGLYSLPRETIAGWDRLAFKLRDTAELLCARYSVPAVLPYTPRGWGYFKEYRSVAKTRALAHASRDWFIVWAGLIAFILRFIPHYRNTHPNQFSIEPASSLLPHWKSLLRSCGWSEDWIAGMEYIADVKIARAGLVHDNIDGPHELDPTLPTLIWFFECGVPVWYRWNDELRKSEKYASPSYQTILPPGGSLDEFGEGRLVPVPELRRCSGSDSTRQLSSDGWFGPAGVAARRAFMISQLEEIEHAALSRQNRETPMEGQVRLQRERNPPAVSAPVFIWTVDLKYPRRLVREAVFKRERYCTLEKFTSNQKRYFAALNVWHCCEDLHPGDGTTDFDDADWDEHPGDVDLEINATSSAYRTASPLPTPQQDFAATDYPSLQFTSQTERNPDPIDGTILRLVSRYYGFVPPIPFPSPEEISPLTLSERESVVFARVLGYSYSEPEMQNFLTTTLASVLFPFYRSFTQRKFTPNPLVNERFDLHPYSRMPLATNPLTKKISIRDRKPATNAVNREEHSRFYIFDIPGPFQLAVMDAATALAICRWEIDDVVDLARKLLEDGVAFHTLKRVPSLPREISDSSIPYTLPERPPNYVFTKTDYESYAHMVQNLLRHPRMRAALLRGGIVWRLAWSSISDADVLDGPTGSYDLALRTSGEDGGLIDDDLSHLELELLVGTYKCWTGQGEGFALKSWWPNVHGFESSGENYGRWTKFRERNYKQRLLEISQGEAQPRGIAEWRDKLKGRTELRNWKSTLERESEAFIQNHCL